MSVSFCEMKLYFFSRKNTKSGLQNFSSDGEKNFCDRRQYQNAVVITNTQIADLTN